MLYHFYLILLFFSHGGGWRGWDGQWKNDFLMSSLHLGGSSSSKKKKERKKEHQGLWVLFICILAWLIQSEDFLVKREGVIVIECYQRWRCPSETQVTVYSTLFSWKGAKRAFSYRNVLKCQRSHSVGIDMQNHHKVGRRYFINTWKWLLSRALDSKCNFISAIPPQKEASEKEWFNFKL